MRHFIHTESSKPNRRLPGNSPVAAKAIGYCFLSLALLIVPTLAPAFQTPPSASASILSFAPPNPQQTRLTSPPLARIENKTSSQSSPLINNEGQVPQDLAAGDFNQDGLGDLAIAFAFDDKVRWYLGAGDGTFSSGGEIEVGIKEGDGNDLPRELLAHDFDDDGFTDLAVLCSGNPNLLNFSEPSLGILYGTPTGGFEKYRVIEMAPFTEPSPEFSRVLEIGLIDGDDRMDIVVGHSDSRQISVILHQGRRLWKAPLLFDVSTTGSGPADIAVEDLDHDGNADLTIANYPDIQVWKGDGTGTFTARVRFTQGSAWTSAVTADFDHDGRWDLALLDGSANKLLLAMGFIAFSAEGPLLKGNLDDYFKTTFEIDLKQNLIDLNPQEPIDAKGPLDLVRYDANQDGIDDLAIIYYTSGGGDIYLGTHDGAANSPPLKLSRHFPTALSPRSIIAADLTADGWDDLAFVHEGDGNENAQTVERNQDLMLDINPALPTATIRKPLPEPAPPDWQLPSSMKRPRGLTWDPTRQVLWTIDRQARELITLSKSGETLTTFSYSQAGLGFLQDPADLAVDETGTLWITDRLATFVYRALPDGTLGSGIIGIPTESAGLLNPSGIAYDADLKRLYVSDETLPLIASYSLNGDLVEVFQIDDQVSALDLAWVQPPDAPPGDPQLWATLAKQNPNAEGEEWSLRVLSLDGNAGRAIPEGGLRAASLGSLPPWAMLRSAALETVNGAGSQEHPDAWFLTDSGAFIHADASAAGNPPFENSEGALTSYSIRQVRELSLLSAIRSAAFPEDETLLADTGIMATLVHISTSGTLLATQTLIQTGNPPLSIEGLSHKNDRIYVLDGRNEVIRVFASDATPLETLGQEALEGLRPRGLHADPDYPYFFVGTPGRLLVLNETGILVGDYPIPASFPPESISGGEKTGEVLLYSPSRKSLLFYRHQYANLPTHPGSLRPIWETLVPNLSSWNRFSPKALIRRESSGDFFFLGSGEQSVLTTRRLPSITSVNSIWQYYP